jgi:thiamine-phosphate pyrophosphorylase
MTLPRVYPILDTESLDRCGVAVETAAAAILEGGAGILQIRQKGHWTRNFFEAARTVASLCRENGTPLIVDDRADFALLLDAGLHVGQDDLTPRDARKLIGTENTLGYSSHNMGQLVAAGGEPVDYVAMGPIFATVSKRNPDPVVGIEEIRRCRALIEKPLVAIGGITMENAPDVWEAGADSVAIIGALLPQPASAHAIRERMETWIALSSGGR